MISIFQHKQYDAKTNWSGGVKEKTYLKKTINGLDWDISPLGTDLGKKYHNREVNLAFFENKFYLEDYTYSIVHVDDSGYRHSFIYSGNILNYYKKYNKMDADYIIDKKIPFSFDEACEYIKKIKEEWIESIS